MWLGKLTALDMTPLGWLGRKTSTQTISSIIALSRQPKDNLSLVTGRHRALKARGGGGGGGGGVG